jgi:hypothetical protein
MFVRRWPLKVGKTAEFSELRTATVIRRQRPVQQKNHTNHQKRNDPIGIAVQRGRQPIHGSKIALKFATVQQY